jgi:FkbM family methyltransferase
MNRALLESFETALAKYQAYRGGAPRGRLARGCWKLRRGGSRYGSFTLRRVLRGEEGQTRLFTGAPFRASLTEYGDALFVFGLFWHEPEIRLTRYLLRHLRRDEHFLDVGANYGYFSALAAELAPGGRVLAFEPSPRVFRALRANLAPYAHAAARRAAVSDTASQAELFEGGRGQTCQSTLDAGLGGAAGFGRVQVEAVALDEACAALDFKPTCLKIDAEGWEAKVLAGAAATLARYSPVVIVEVWAKPLAQHLESVRALTALGYRPFSISAAGEAVALAADALAPAGCIWDNLVFLKQPGKHKAGK